ncbi:MAG: hypothetical protein JSW61_00430 [Candidatus Thorarchaeota archaeon]|nr:MAG: hypothetical protein JSW61_00430 [Candidatus Thorarchaeota archaeon]
MGVKNWSFVPWQTDNLVDTAIETIAVDTPNYMTRRISSFEYGHCQVPGRVPTAHVHVLYSFIRGSLLNNVLPIFIFDGPPEARKRPTNPSLIQLARSLYAQFMREQDVFDTEIAEALIENPALKWYFRASHIRDLCVSLGIPSVTASSEAEMTAAALVIQGRAETVLSNDSDALLFGSAHVTRSIRFSSREIENVTLDALKKCLGLNLMQLKDLAIICGCDFHPGMKGVGPRKGIVLLNRFGNLESILKCKGISQTERNEFLNAREIFDEAEDIRADSLDLSLNAPIVPRVLKLFSPIIGEENANRTAREIVATWKDFGKEQATLERWV